MTSKLLASNLASSASRRIRPNHHRVLTGGTSLSNISWEDYSSSTNTPDQHQHSNNFISSHPRREEDDDKKNRSSLPHRIAPHNSIGSVRGYHTTRHNENSAIILGLGAVALTAKATQYGVRAFVEWKDSQPEAPPVTDDAEESTSKAQTDGGGGTAKDAKSDKKTGKRENFFEKWFGASAGAKYYEGGFEEDMTRREAALILGVRESATAKRIRDGHKKLLVANHPDTGGSTYITTKLNEAKEMLLKGKGK